MPVYTAQSSGFLAPVQDANQGRIIQRQLAGGASVPPSDLLAADNPEVLRQYINGTQARHRDAFPLNDNLIEKFFLIQSEVSHISRERLISAKSLRNISLEKYSYEMLKTFSPRPEHLSKIHPPDLQEATAATS